MPMLYDYLDRNVADLVDDDVFTLSAIRTWVFAARNGRCAQAMLRGGFTSRRVGDGLLAHADRPRFFRKLATLMKPGGLLVMTVHHGPPPPGTFCTLPRPAEIEGLARARAGGAQSCDLDRSIKATPTDILANWMIGKLAIVMADTFHARIGLGLGSAGPVSRASIESLVQCDAPLDLPDC